MAGIGSSKTFSEKDLKENDDIAKKVALCHLLNKGYTLTTPLERQIERFKDWDFEVEYKGVKVPVEVERKKVWKSNTSWLPYETIDIPYRKKDSKSVLFVMTNRDCKAIAVCKTSDILTSPVKTKNTTYTANERFFAVDKSKFRFYFNL